MLLQSQEVPLVAPDRLGRSRPASPWAVFVATVIKDLQISRRYIPDLIGKFVELAIRMGFYLLLSTVIAVKVDSAPLAGGMSDWNLFVFFQGGLLLFVFGSIALSMPVNTVTRDLQNGTLEYLYSNPSSRYAYLVGSVVADALFSLIIFLPLYLCLAVTSGAGLVNMLVILVVCLTVLVTLVALGVMMALLVLLWRRVSSVIQVLTILFEMITGAFIPVSAFPPALQYIAYLLPFTWGYDLIRFYSFDGKWTTLAPIEAEWAILVVQALLFTVVSRLLMARAEREAKRNGLHLL